MQAVRIGNGEGVFSVESKVKINSAVPVCSSQVDAYTMCSVNPSSSGQLVATAMFGAKYIVWRLQAKMFREQLCCGTTASDPIID